MIPNWNSLPQAAELNQIASLLFQISFSFLAACKNGLQRTAKIFQTASNFFKWYLGSLIDPISKKNTCFIFPKFISIWLVLAVEVWHFFYFAFFLNDCFYCSAFYELLHSFFFLVWFAIWTRGNNKWIVLKFSKTPEQVFYTCSRFLAPAVFFRFAISTVTNGSK